MKPYRDGDGVTLYVGDCLDVLPTLPAESVDAIVTDPPYHLTTGKKGGTGPASVNLDSPYGRARIGTGFMGKAWDGGDVAFRPDVWREILRVAKPGAHLLAFGGTRTYHRLVCAIEDAGWEIRDTVMWVYGSGFPKSLDVSKAIDKEAGAVREVLGVSPNWRESKRDREKDGSMEVRGENAGLLHGDPVTDAAKQWDGWGTALKPSHEEILIAQKPYDLSQLCAILAHTIHGAICQLPSYVKDAGEPSKSSLSGCVGDADSALWRAVRQSSTPGDLYALMATSPSEWAPISSLSTAWSWLHTLAGLSEHASMFTTETASGLTTDLRTLNSSPLRITPATILEAASSPDGTGSAASIVAGLFSAVDAKLHSILALSALDPATSQDGGLGLRPNALPITLARKPLSGTVAANVQQYGTGALNIDASRIPTTPGDIGNRVDDPAKPSHRPVNHMNDDGSFAKARNYFEPSGRWPANLIHDGSPEVLEGFPEQESGGVPPTRPAHDSFRGFAGNEAPTGIGASSGNASRFFYAAKASRQDRGEGNDHPTVKPLDLMRYLIRLITPPGGVVLDPFAGSGSTLVAAQSIGFRSIGIDLEEKHAAIAAKRLAQGVLDLGAA